MSQVQQKDHFGPKNQEQHEDHYGTKGEIFVLKKNSWA